MEQWQMHPYVHLLYDMRMLSTALEWDEKSSGWASLPVRLGVCSKVRKSLSKRDTLLLQTKIVPIQSTLFKRLRCGSAHLQCPTLRYYVEHDGVPRRLHDFIHSIKDNLKGTQILGCRFLKLAAGTCLLYTSPSPRDGLLSRMPSSA